MDKKFWIAGIVASILFFVLGFVVHGLLLEADYANFPLLMRTKDEAMGNLPYMILAHLLMGFAFAWIYSKGIDSGSAWLPQGLGYGIGVSLLTVVPWYLIYYSVQPWGRRIVAKQIVFDGIGVLIVAIVTAFIYKQPTVTTES